MTYKYQYIDRSSDARSFVQKTGGPGFESISMPRDLRLSDISIYLEEKPSTCLFPTE